MESESPAIDYKSDEIKEKIDRLKAALNIKDEQEVELTEEAKAARLEAEVDGSPIQGKDINWDEYNLPDEYEHLYKKAELKNTEDGPKWVVALDEFYSASKSYTSMKRINKKGEPESLGEYLTWMVNGPDGWRIASLLPQGTGFGAVVFQRKIPVILPDPIPLELTEEKPITPEELQETEDAGLAWAGLPPVEKILDDVEGAVEGGDIGQLEQSDKAGEEESV